MPRFLDDNFDEVLYLLAHVAALEAAGYIMAAAITSAAINTALGLGANVGTNATGAKTISTSAPSGGSNGDIWYQV